MIYTVSIIYIWQFLFCYDEEKYEQFRPICQPNLGFVWSPYGAPDGAPYEAPYGAPYGAPYAAPYGAPCGAQFGLADGDTKYGLVDGDKVGQGNKIQTAIYIYI